MPGYHGVDTVYHDRQHSLDMTLAMARLMMGYERSVEPRQRFGAERAVMGLVTSLFHDAGYIREFGDRQHRNGAEFTRTHVSRGARFLEEYLPDLGLGAWVPMTSQIIHFTGYEVPFGQIEAKVPDRRDVMLGHLLGTADMVAQGAVVIDVGINRTEDGMAGDVDFGPVSEIAGAITPVPGGIGPMTIAMLLSNTLQAARASLAP